MSRDCEPAVTVAGVPEPSGNETRRLLGLFPRLPSSLEKSAHMLMLKYLRAQGWESTILTVTDGDGNPGPDVEYWEGVEVVRIKLATSVGCRRFGPGRDDNVPWGAILGRLSLPDAYARLSGRLLTAGREWRQRRRPAAIVSLYYPLTSHTVASRLAHEARLPWLALTKDFYSWPDSFAKTFSAKVRNRVKRLIERRTLRNAQLVASINDNLTEYLQKLLPQTKVLTLAHCFDPAAFVECPKLHRTHKVVFTSVGRTTETEREGLRLFFQAVTALKESGDINANEVEFRFVGHGGAIVAECATAAGCAELVNIIPPQPHAAAMRELQLADCLLFQQAPWGNRRRLPEYFGARKPILAFPSYVGIMSERLLQQYGGATIAMDVVSIKACLRSWLHELQRIGSIRFTIDEGFVASFSAVRRAEELSRYLEPCSSKYFVVAASTP